MLIHPIATKVLPVMAQGIPVCLYGEAGVGKTTLVQQIAQELDLPFYPLTFTSGMTETSLLGNWVLNKEGTMTYATTPFITAVEEGGVFLADEFDAADANVALAINNILENGMTALPRRHYAPMLKAHKNFRFVACVNTLMDGASTKFTGRNALDAATISRFEGGIFMVAPVDKIEAQILPYKPINILMRAIRLYTENYAKSRNISTRTFKRAKLVVDAQIFTDWVPFVRHFTITWTNEEVEGLIKFLTNKFKDEEVLTDIKKTLINKENPKDESNENCDGEGEMPSNTSKDNVSTGKFGEKDVPENEAPVNVTLT